jgi:hypothetical protein
MASFPVELILDSPWQRLLHHIPFSRNVCVAGSVGTWFARLALTGVIPLWSPGDVDVFVLTKSDSDFAQLVLSVAQNVFAKSDTVQSLLRVEAALAGTRKRVIDLHVEANVVLSFIQVTFYVSEEYCVEYLMRSFDINVCKVVALHRRIAVVQTATEAAGETVPTLKDNRTFINSTFHLPKGRAHSSFIMTGGDRKKVQFSHQNIHDAITKAGGIHLSTRYPYTEE